MRLLSILSEEEFLPNVNRSTLNRTLDRLVIKVIFLYNDYLLNPLHVHHMQTIEGRCDFWRDYMVFKPVIAVDIDGAVT